MQKAKIFLITGLSGSGKTLLLKSLEDEGFFTVDNVPPHLIRDFINIACTTDIKKIAIVSDIRWKKTSELIDAFLNLHNYTPCDIDVKKIFLTSEKSILLNRFIKSRRNHPLNLPVAEAIDKEIELLNPVKDISDIVIDTSNTEPSELRKRFLSLIEEKSVQLTLDIISFGFKHGIPQTADYVFDVRYMKNPFYFLEMYKLNGTDEKIINYLESFPETFITVEKIADYARFVQDSYTEVGRLAAHFCIGCTGGKHRSVYVAQKIHDILKGEGRDVNLLHRDFEKE
jgi:UPF0042 nucleotide-binding protein